jgi:hypothetical protein
VNAPFEVTDFTVQARGISVWRLNLLGLKGLKVDQPCFG